MNNMSMYFYFNYISMAQIDFSYKNEARSDCLLCRARPCDNVAFLELLYLYPGAIS